MANSKSNPTRKAKYAAQYARTEANKKRKLAKHVRKYQNDEQAKAVLK